MKRISFILFALLMAASAFAGEATWLTSLPEAADQARKGNELLLLDFTGSDWCGWCMKLEAETFSNPQFIDYARNNLVLVKLDFPRQKSQSDELKEANSALQKKYGVNGFPTVLLIKPDGTVLWEQRGYAAGGPIAMIQKINQSRTAAGLAAPDHPTAIAPTAPMQPPAARPRAPGDEPKLQAILYSATHSCVMLDGKTCEEGDTMHGMRVVKITRDKVTVEYQGKTKVINMREQ
jgi:protein disulfide-isomerase